MVGLAVLVGMTVQGMSMLAGWRLPDKFPDIFLVSLKLGGLSPTQWTTLGQTPGIRRFADGSPQFCPVAVTVSGLGNNPLALVGAVLAPTINIVRTPWNLSRVFLCVYVYFFPIYYNCIFCMRHILPKTALCGIILQQVGQYVWLCQVIYCYYFYAFHIIYLTES